MAIPILKDFQYYIYIIY